MNKTKSCSLGGACGAGIVGILCPLCLPAIAALLSSIGLGFVVSTTVIWPVLGFFVLLLLLGLVWGYKRHGNVWPLIIGILGIIAIPAGNYIVMARPLTYIGVAVVVASALWNLTLDKKTISASPMPQIPPTA